MIFLSHNSKDKPIVEQIAKPLLKKYGIDNIFYDSWSIRPGDSIIDKMDEGLKNCEFFLFFISVNSLNSEMVKLEWQAALLKKASKNIKFIPIRISNVQPPHIIAQLLYIDLYQDGLDVAIRQIIDVIDNNNTHVLNNDFSNINVYVSQNASEILIEFRAECFLEAHPSFLILCKNDPEYLDCRILGQQLASRGMHKNISVNGQICNALSVAIHEPITPNFPMRVKIQQKEGIKIIGFMQQISAAGEFKVIPAKFVRFVEAF